MYSCCLLFYLNFFAAMIATTQRQLVNIDILLSDIEMLEHDAYASPEHIRLLSSLEKALAVLNEKAEYETVASFHNAVKSAGLEHTFKDKILIGIYQRLISYVLEYWDAQTKIHGILDDYFDTHSEKRLHLLQTKSTRAKTQFKTVAMAMGQKDYEHFIALLGLHHEDWVWRR
ncbi:hypothetical protein [Alteromonas confluentis]|uniref:hypothetical protein n=1 Tax=Alteromonas confluentis TaxID=1656094 RepID=UPI0009F39236|nr:hypothetical protein [Alteromonas confluentis]